MIRRTRNSLGIRAVAAVALAVGLLASACGGDDSGPIGGGTTDGSKTTEGGDNGDNGDNGDGQVPNLDDVQSATIQIKAQGTFVEPEGSLAEAVEYVQAGSGSGFIVDPSGLAVTNNHVVTGAATLEVFIGGEDKAKTAKVLGVSECSDLAVIDIEGDGYPYLGWYSGEVKPGLEVYSAGFPLGDPDFTLTKGIVSKLKDEQPFNFAQVRGVIEHDAAIQPGNSGGPLVTADGEVVGVNYAGLAAATTTEQFWAIDGDTAEPIVAELGDEKNVESLGLNGQAVFDEENGTVGIWVASVASGSPAGEIGIQGGDIIERLEGLPMGMDGQLTDYCKVLRSHDATDVMSVQVLRFADMARYRGEFNGDELTPFESLAEDVETGDLESGGGTYSEYVTISDDSGILTVNVPAEWSDVQGTALTLDDGTELPQVMASTSLDSYLAGYDVPGMQFAAATPDLGTVPGDFLDNIAPSGDCSPGPDGRQAYDDGLYTGEMDLWVDCGGTQTQVLTIAAQPAGGEFTAIVFIQMVSDADLDAADTIIQTFQVNVGE